MGDSEFSFGEMRILENSPLENLRNHSEDSPKFSFGELGVPVWRIRNSPLEDLEFPFGGVGVLLWSMMILEISPLEK